MPNIRLIIEYDGARFHGWQKQPGLRTIQGELHKVLEMILREEISCVYASGRTDAGVHARAQVVNFQVKQEPDLYILKHSVSSILRGEVAVLSADLVPENFHAQRDALAKQYSYIILNRIAPPALDKGKVWHIGAKLDYQRMNEEARKLIGEHDFSSFRGKDCGAGSTIKKIMESEVSKDGDYVYYRVVGTGFLKQMVRIITGTLVDIGRGNADLSSVPKILAAKDRRVAGNTAPPQGLFLDWVKYS